MKEALECNWLGEQTKHAINIELWWEVKNIENISIIRLKKNVYNVSYS